MPIILVDACVIHGKETVIMKINQVGTTVNPIPSKSTEAQPKTIESKGIKQRDNNIGSPQASKAIDGSNAAKVVKGEDFDDEMMKQAMEQANKSLAGYNRYIERAVHEVTHAVMYTIKDTKTNEVIAEFPPRKIQDMIAKMWEIAGLFVDEKA